MDKTVKPQAIKEIHREDPIEASSVWGNFVLNVIHSRFGALAGWLAGRLSLPGWLAMAAWLAG